MRIGVVPEGPLERVLLATRALPTPLLESMTAMMLARTLMVGCKLGVFEALAGGALDAEGLAGQIGADARATRKLLDALVAARYLRTQGGRYALAPVARKWLLPEGRTSLRDNLLFRFVEWDLLSGYEAFVRTGKPLDMHDNADASQWSLYQRGMRSLASLSADEIARRMPVPAQAAALLDIGGSHGLYSVRLCQRHPALRATILDLPEAVRHAAPILAREGMGDRVVHRAGNALKDDLGDGAFDVVLISNLVHHFDDPTNRALARRVARALRPGGIFAILEPLRPASPETAGQVGALLDLFFAMTSASGTWTLEELRDWQRDAGLAPRHAIRLRTLPGAVIQAATRR
jgi:SAM-dependent methyltransferase